MCVDRRNGPYSLSAYGSNGNYISSIVKDYNDHEVYYRQSLYGDERVIYYATGVWYISQYKGGGYYASCNEEDIFNCEWWKICLTSAYASEALYKANGQWNHGKPVYQKQGGGDTRYLVYSEGSTHWEGWWIEPVIHGTTYYDYCNFENKYECDESNFGIDPACIGFNVHLLHNLI